jgi:hypothetical protein
VYLFGPLKTSKSEKFMHVIDSFSKFAELITKQTNVQKQ